MPWKIARCQKNILAFERLRAHQFCNWCAFVFLQDLPELQGDGRWRELGAGSRELGAGP